MLNMTRKNILMPTCHVMAMLQPSVFLRFSRGPLRGHQGELQREGEQKYENVS